jgi:hypothetical protein
MKWSTPGPSNMETITNHWSLQGQLYPEYGSRWFLPQGVKKKTPHFECCKDSFILNMAADGSATGLPPKKPTL